MKGTAMLARLLGFLRKAINARKSFPRPASEPAGGILGLLILLCAVAPAGKLSAQESPHGRIRFECSSCHTPESWKMPKDAPFMHQSTGFTLTGQHTNLRCVNCHEGLKFKNRSSDCLSCHSNIHKSELGTNCLRCHTTQSWRVSDMVQKHQVTRFPLLGRHAVADCQVCHANAGRKQFTGTPTDCYACHREDFNRSASPNHSAAGFSTNCTQCHLESAMHWGGGFQHDRTQFPLTGAHRSIACIDCHKDQVFKSTSVQCIACHQNDYSSTRNPNHSSAHIATTCQTCHTTTVWRPSTFSHATTAFQLVGAHTTVACNQCHVNNVFSGLPHAGCWDCHATTFNGAINPNHVAGQFNHDCLQCHTQSAWKPATFNHATTKFALTGAHAATQCARCHTSGNYQLQYTDCYVCHSTKFAQPANPNHVLGNFNHDCAPCHTTTVWSPSTFTHARTAFQLVGAHQAVACNQCHVNNVFKGLPHAGCWDCHATAFNGTVNPSHVAGQFNHDCLQCHTQSAWRPASFNHATTKFALTGAHTTLQCTQCHVNGNYALSYQNCYQCHSVDFARPSNPNHVAQQLPTDCVMCHSTSAWTPNTMNHDAAYFRIYSGKHRGRWTQCSQCHTTPGNLASFSCTTACHRSAHNQGQDCYGCHRNE
ncbi:MAG: hypothetical protein H6Q31_983 [Bacteroidetes bacterium]|nr:hypothetical protein [Bacteroidota bacterium]